MIKFTQITEKLKYPSKYKAQLSTLHADIITYVIDNFQNTNRYKTKVVSILNTISYYIISEDVLPTSWSATNPFENINIIDSNICEESLGDLFLHVKNITWDIEEASPKSENSDSELHTNDVSNVEAIAQGESNSTIISSTPISTSKETTFNIDCIISTPKEDLYIRPPAIPQFDTNSPWIQQLINNTVYTIYRSLPEIPLTQSQISVTTDISKMTASDLLKLYPNCFIRTRSATMYEAHEGLTLDSTLGIIFPVEGFTYEQVKDNIIKYPHLFKLTRMLNDKIVSFYSNIEIDGQLYKTLDVWDDLPDSKYIPRNSEFIKEYVVRRYLLERDIKHIQHNFPMFGTLDPFLTLFTTQDNYIELGYSDTLEIAKQCVNSRVSYKRSRNPILRMVYNE